MEYKREATAAERDYFIPYRRTTQVGHEGRLSWSCPIMHWKFLHRARDLRMRWDGVASQNLSVSIVYNL